MTLADERLHAWAQKTKTPKELNKSHTHKLQEVRGPLIRVVIPKKAGSDGVRRATTTEYSKPEELATLLEVCRYGPNDGSADLGTYFQNRWFTDELERDLQNKIEWTEIMIGVFETYPTANP
ncbi:MAG: hypothetical protein KGI60_01700 [Patescibacteria group bacterium]|nr:hypothetical protein [Patescibacteria group bacterium]